MQLNSIQSNCNPTLLPPQNTNDSREPRQAVPIAVSPPVPPLCTRSTPGRRLPDPSARNLRSRIVLAPPPALGLMKTKLNPEPKSNRDQRPASKREGREFDGRLQLQEAQDGGGLLLREPRLFEVILSLFIRAAASLGSSGCRLHARVGLLRSRACALVFIQYSGGDIGTARDSSSRSRTAAAAA